MNYKNVLIGVFAILVAALIFDIPLVVATNINIYYDVGGGNYIKQDDVTIEPENLIGRSISIKNIGGVYWTNAKVIINISNSSMANLEKVYVYKCKGLSPNSCVETRTPDMYEILNNDLGLELLWNDNRRVITACSSSPNSCLEVANLFFLFRINDNGKIIWVGIWNKIERRTYNFVAPYLFEYSLDEIDLYAQAGFAVPVKEFIQTYLTIPFNPVWVSTAIFQGADSLYELSVSSSSLQQPSPSFSTLNHTGDTINSISKDYSFVFSKASQDIFNPTTLRLNPSFFCGQYGCETGKGETSANCCYDCPCSQGYYCDGGTGGVCKPENLISLVLYETPNVSISNCNQQHVINVTAKVNYAPSDMDLIRSKYKLKDTSYSTQCKKVISNVYRCPITVPPMPDCQEGEYTIGPNYLNFTISYTDGPNPKTKILVLRFPDIVVGSFICGENGCESELGENSDNCCYDCGCPSGYCDIEDGADLGTGTCKQDITVNNLQITAKPTHFYTHNNMSGDRVDIILQITDAPLSLEITSSSCEMDCSNNCSVSCSLSCSEISSSDANIFNASCLLTFLISDYNKTVDYSLFPTMNISVIYTNGSFGDVNKTFSKLFTTISVGSGWCGDGACAPDENQLNCCYDCGCPEGYYCDTANAGAPTAGDSCKSEEGIRLVVDGVERNTFDYSDISHYTILMAHVENAPTSLNGSTSCMFGNGSSIYCNMDCIRFGDPSSHILQCNLSIPVIDYKTSPFYDPNTRRIIIGPNTINYSVTFNNGSGLISKELSGDFSSIIINVKPRCGTGAGYLGIEGERCMPYNRTLACETGLGESYATCCCDCPCPTGQYCYFSNEYSPGTCKSVDSINLIIEEVVPEPKECRIDRFKEKCQFYESEIAAVRIEPVANYSYMDAYFEMDGKKPIAWCIPATDSPPWNRFNCSAVLPNIEGTNIQPGNIDKQLGVSVAIRSTGLLDTTVSATDTITIKKVKGEELKALELQLDELDKVIDKLNSVRTWLWVWVGVLVAACIALCIWVQSICGYCIAFGVCFLIDLIGAIITISKEIDMIKGWKEELNSAALPLSMDLTEYQYRTSATSVISAIKTGLGCLMIYGAFGAASPVTETLGVTELPPARIIMIPGM